MPQPQRLPAQYPQRYKPLPNRTVPFDAREQWGSTVRRALEEVSAASERGGEDGVRRAFSALLRLPSQVLTDSGRGRGRRARTRLQRVDDGLEVDIDERAGTRRLRRQQNTAHAAAARAHRQLTLGSITRAVKCLAATPIAEPTDATVETLRALHPTAPPPAVPASTTAAVTVTLDILSDVLQALPKGSAPGPSGWTYEHIKAATQAGNCCALLGVINVMIRGDLPHVPELLDSRLIGLEKPGGRGLRPIAIGEVFFRLAGLCAMAARPGAGRALAPLQLGVRVKGGSQIIGHALSSGIAADPDCVTLQLDFRNAFNSLSRDAMLAAVAKCQPALLPFAAWAYRQPSRLIMTRAPEHAAPITSECGVRQGDPCGGLFFSLTTQDQLETIGLTHPDAAPLAYMDDTFLQGSAAAVTAAFSALCRLSAAVGLDVRHDKGGVYSPNVQAARDTAAALGIPHCIDGLTAAGTPVGTDAFITAHAASSAESICKIIDDLLDSPLPTQDKFLILRSSAQMRLAHFPRTAPWHLINEAVKQVEDKAVKATFNILQRPEQDDVRSGQLTLPLRFGGMGIRTTSMLEAQAAYLSAAAMTETAMREGRQQYRPFTSPNAAFLELDWQALHEAGAEKVLWPPESLAIGVQCIDEVLPGAQRAFSHFVAQRRFDDLLASFDTNTEAGASALARMHSCACRPASIWLDTLPTSPFLQLSNGDFVAAMRHRLGMTHLPANAPGVRCSCGRFMQPNDTDHAMTCKSLCGEMTMRHNMIARSWRRIISRSGTASSLEPAIRALPGARGAAVSARHTDSRGDILLILPDGLTVVDISVVHPCASTYVRAARVAGGAALVRDDAKRAKYETADPAGYAFVPLSHESFGRMGTPAMELLNSLAVLANAGGRVVKAGFVGNALKELSISLCRGNALMYRRGLGALARTTGSCFAAGLTVPTADVQ